MLLNPRVGQIVKHDSFDGRMVVKSVESDGVVVEFFSGHTAYGEICYITPIITAFPAAELYLA